MLETLEFSTVLLGIAVTAFIIILLSPSKKKHKNLPPGPPAGLPFFGQLLTYLKRDFLYKDFAEMGKKYGNVVRVRFGVYDAFILNGYDVMKEAMVDKADLFSERPRWLYSVTSFGREKAGMFFHEQWHDRRRFTLVSMRDFGLGKKSLEERMIEEAGFLNEELDRREGKPTDPTEILPFTTTNIICSVIAGKRFPYGDEKFGILLDSLNVLVRGSTALSLQNFVPFFQYIPTPDFTASQNKIGTLLSMAAEWRKEHEEDFDPDNLRDLVDLFIAENRKEGTHLDDNDIKNLILDLFVAGTETTSTTLSWALLYLIHHQDVQDRCRAEIQEEIGLERPPTYADIKNTPYINAVINEVQRIGNILPFSIWHCASENAELAGYTIPRGSIVILNLDTALKDEKYFDDPHAFRPDRWLDEQGQMKKNPAFIPFSIGKRICLGEQLAKKELYIFLTSMLQKFRFTMADEKCPPSLDGIPGTIHGPGSFEVRAVKV